MFRTCLLLTACAIAQLSATEFPHTGTWHLNLQKSEAPKQPMKLEVGNGRSKCFTCDPPEDVLADGSDQSVAGNPYYDTVAAHIVDDRTVLFTWKKAGKVVGETKNTISEDLNHISVESRFYPPNGSAPTSVSFRGRRDGSPRPGMHALTGAWLMEKTLSMSENAREITVKQTAEGLELSEPTGYHYSAKFDGKEYPTFGGASGETVSVKLIDNRTVEYASRAKGKVRENGRVTVAPDGKSLTIEWRSSDGFSGKDYYDRK
ncbi:MAG TPA: hypothetical protein VKU01_09170 [Bryobacteraceae bacterium]|nr:hypothetical protein [Bryobacteraceae bacterium]